MYAKDLVSFVHTYLRMHVFVHECYTIPYLYIHTHTHICIYINKFRYKKLYSGLSCDCVLMLAGADGLQRFSKCHEQWTKVRGEYRATERQVAGVQEQLLALLGDAKDQDHQVQAKVCGFSCRGVCVQPSAYWQQYMLNRSI
jgi:hypothetical protein